MPGPYSFDLRVRVVAAVSAGASCRQVAERFGVGAATVVRWAQRARRTGHPTALPMGGKRPFVLAEDRDWLRQRLSEKPDLTLRELQAELAPRKKVSYGALWGFCAHLGLSFKKNRARQRTGSSGRGAAARAMATLSG